MHGTFNRRTATNQLAKHLSLPETYKSFSLTKRKLQREYFERFEAICDEIRKAEPEHESSGSQSADVANLLI
jgi:hypothetical protein